MEKDVSTLSAVQSTLILSLRALPPRNTAPSSLFDNSEMEDWESLKEQFPGHGTPGHGASREKKDLLSGSAVKKSRGKGRYATV
eukprot:6039118-Prymnesium_polylepis.1